MDELSPGKLLIADPFLKDPNFSRTAIFICEHQDTGSFGFVLNKEYPHDLNEMVSNLEHANFPVYYGGPVQKDTLHFLHQCPHLISGAHEVVDGIYWGGEFGDVVELVNQQKITPNDIRFFIGYSGWGEGQLVDEMKHKSWIVAPAKKTLVFRKDVDNTWKEALKELGGEYRQMINYPIDPQLN